MEKVHELSAFIFLSLKFWKQEAENYSISHIPKCSPAAMSRVYLHTKWAAYPFNRKVTGRLLRQKATTVAVLVLLEHQKHD